MVLKLQKADAAADDSREQIDCEMFRFIHCSIADLERLPGLKTMWVRKLKAYADRWSRLLERGATLMQLVLLRQAVEVIVTPKS